MYPRPYKHLYTVENFGAAIKMVMKEWISDSHERDSNEICHINWNTHPIK